MSKSDILERFLRSLVTLAITAGFIYGFLTDKVSAEAFIGVVGMVITYWFSQHRSGQRATDQPTATNGGAGPEGSAPK